MARVVMALRRYYLQKQRTAEAYGDDAIALAWRAKRLAESGTPIPTGFAARAACLAAGYLVMEELDGASIDELCRAGLSRRDATAVFNRIEGIIVSTTYFQIGPRAGEAYEQDDVSLIASGARDASFNSAAYEVGDKSTLRLTLDVTAASGTTPLLQAQIQTRKNSDDTWRNVDAFPAVSAVGTSRKVFPGCDREVRAVCSLGGTTPSFTFSLSGEAL